MTDFCICILAHNEQKHIAATIRAYAEQCLGLHGAIKVYANGCTDQTVDIVQSLVSEIPNLSLRIIDEASKSKAWNTAFHENGCPILIYSDGDVYPEKGAVTALLSLLQQEALGPVLVGCSFWPNWNKASWEQRLTGFLQIPLNQNFLTGQLYTVKRSELKVLLCEHSLSGLPDGLVGEDCFLQYLVPRDKFWVIKNKVYYDPPTFADYFRYLARLQWQEEQISKHYGGIVQSVTINTLRRFKEKIFSTQSVFHFVGLCSAPLRFLVKALFRKQVAEAKDTLGRATVDGSSILSQASRSQSTK